MNHAGYPRIPTLWTVPRLAIRRARPFHVCQCGIDFPPIILVPTTRIDPAGGTAVDQERQERGLIVGNLQ